MRRLWLPPGTDAFATCLQRESIARRYLSPPPAPPTYWAYSLNKSYGAPRITKDGVTVAKEIELADRFENMGAQMIKEVATRTSDQAGDGTTTATVLAQAIVREGTKAVAASHRRTRPEDL